MEYYYQGGLIFCGVPGQSGTPQNIVGSQGKVILEFLDSHQFTDITVDPGQSGNPTNIVGSQGKVILEFLDSHQFTDITVDFTAFWRLIRTDEAFTKSWNF